MQKWVGLARKTCRKKRSWARKGHSKKKVGRGKPAKKKEVDPQTAQHKGLGARMLRMKTSLGRIGNKVQSAKMWYVLGMSGDGTKISGRRDGTGRDEDLKWEKFFPKDLLRTRGRPDKTNLRDVGTGRDGTSFFCPVTSLVSGGNTTDTPPLPQIFGKNKGGGICKKFFY